jgi:hypothetical protein
MLSQEKSGNPGHSFALLQVTYSFCKEFLQVLLLHVGPEGELGCTEVMRRVFEKSGKAR